MANLLDNTYFANVRVVNCGDGTSLFVGNQAGQQIFSNGAYCCNTFFGACAGFGLVAGSSNTLFGSMALYGIGAVASTSNNVVIGHRAMWQTQNNSNKNIAIGVFSMQNNNSSNENVALGYKAMWQTQNTSQNVFAGYCAGGALASGSRNVGIGYRALRCATSTNYNVALGRNSLYNVANGNANIGIGTNAGNGVVNSSYTISVGYGATTTDNAGHTIAGSNAVTLHQVQGNAWAIASDSRDKTDIIQLNNNLGLNFIRNLRPVKFNLDIRETYVTQCGFEFGEKDGTLKREDESYGFIAQEMEETLNDLDVEFDALKFNEDKSKYMLTYDNLIAPIVKSLQQTIERLEYLESKVN